MGGYPIVPLPQPPQAGAVPQVPQGGMYHPGGGMMPYQPNPVADTIGSIGNFMSGVFASKQQAKQQAQQDLMQGLQMMQAGLPVDHTKLEKSAKKAGWDKYFDFNATAPPPQPYQGAPTSANIPAMANQTTELGAPPPGQAPQIAQQIAAPLATPPPPPPAGAPPPPPGLLARIMGAVGMHPGTGPLPGMNENWGKSQFGNALDQIQQTATQQRAMQTKLQGLQYQGMVDEAAQKHRVAQMLNTVETGILPNGEHATSDQIFQLKANLHEVGAMKLIDPLDTMKFRAMGFDPYGDGSGPAALGKNADPEAIAMQIWRFDKPEQYFAAKSKRQEELEKRGMSSVSAKTAVDEEYGFKPYTVAPPKSPEFLLRGSENIKRISEAFPTITAQQFGSIPQSVIESGDTKRIQGMFPDLMTKGQIDTKIRKGELDVSWANNAMAHSRLDFEKIVNGQTQQQRKLTNALHLIDSEMDLDKAIKSGAIKNDPQVQNALMERLKTLDPTLEMVNADTGMMGGVTRPPYLQKGAPPDRQTSNIGVANPTANPGFGDWVSEMWKEANRPGQEPTNQVLTPWWKPGYDRAITEPLSQPQFPGAGR